jgi:hypothetical protein
MPAPKREHDQQNQNWYEPFHPYSTSNSSTAGMEARIQTGTLPTFGFAGLFDIGFVKGLTASIQYAWRFLRAFLDRSRWHHEMKKRNLAIPHAPKPDGSRLSHA